MEVEIHIHLKPRDALFIGGGSGRSGIGVDAATVRGSDDCLIIPGSTFKGKLRNECERIAKAFGRDICLSPVPEDMCPHYFLKDRNEMYYCQICRMFGSPWFKSPLRFSDLVWQVPEGLSYHEWRRIRKTEVRPGVSISRYTRTKKEKKLFFIEVMRTGANASFDGSITGSLDTKGDLALLIGGLKVIFALGGMKSRGIGWISSLTTSKGYQVSTPEFSDSDFEKELRQW